MCCRLALRLIVPMMAMHALVLSGCQGERQPPIDPVELPPLPDTPPREGATNPNEELLTVYVSDVLEGDVLSAVDVNGTQAGVRLYGVDSPAPGQAYAAEATQYTASLCVGQYVKLRLMGTDADGRHVATVLLPNEDNLNERVVEAGMAHWFAKFAPDDSRLAYFQERARRDRVGLWAGADPVPPWEYGAVAARPLTPIRQAGDTGIARAVQPVSRPAPSQTAPQETTIARPMPTREAPMDVTVYITNTGNSYHLGTCRHLASSKYPIALSMARSSYAPCRTCKAPR